MFGQVCQAAVLVTVKSAILKCLVTALLSLNYNNIFSGCIGLNFTTAKYHTIVSECSEYND